MPKPAITLLTDFGLRDHYVGTMKGVILGICPESPPISPAARLWMCSARRSTPRSGWAACLEVYSKAGAWAKSDPLWSTAVRRRSRGALKPAWRSIAAAPPNPIAFHDPELSIRRPYLQYQNESAQQRNQRRFVLGFGTKNYDPG
jgi:hypothetical protein